MEPIKTGQSSTATDAGSRHMSNDAKRSPGTGTGAGKDVDLVDDAKGFAGTMVDQAQSVVGGQLSRQQERSAGELGKVAEALRGTNLSDTVAGPYVEKAAAMIDRFSGSVRNATLDDTVRAVESYARREPLLFLGGAFAIGLLAGRFLKSSAQANRDDDQRLLPAGSNGDHQYSSARSYGAGTGASGYSSSSPSAFGAGAYRGTVGMGSTGGMGSTSGNDSGTGRPPRGTRPQGKRGPDGTD